MKKYWLEPAIDELNVNMTECHEPYEDPSGSECEPCDPCVPQPCQPTNPCGDVPSCGTGRDERNRGQNRGSYRGGRGGRCW